jgi:hypothetical protein
MHLPGPRRLWVACALACLIGLGLVLSPTGKSRYGPVGLRLSSHLSLDATASQAAETTRVAGESWLGGATTASDGEVVNVNVADSIPDPDAVRQRWADFFAGLVHGPELQLLAVYVVPGAEISADCGGDGILGCYGQQRLLIPNDVVDGVTPEEVARHEYGHHVANNRVNAPWQAVDWGPKRWASQIGVCAKAQQGLVFPGDESDHYRLNPGEAWAETYRVLNETKLGLPVTWPVVDSSFLPGQAELAVAEQDVTAPWSGSVAHVYRARFANGRKRWSLTVQTRLDGELKASLTLPRGHVYRLAVLGADGKTVLANGLWTAQTAQVATFTVCGQRSVLVRVVGDGSTGRFTVATTTP